MVEEILENLIGQFSDPLTFYRELIQNALDAGARQVQVNVTQRAEPPGAIIEVSDWGEGMNRRIITQDLTRLFSSSKESDFTKIGKFGIGFVSVFAIKPELVVVDTGRDGESWRVVFDGSPTYQCLRLDAPVEGTQIRIYKAMPLAEFDDFLARSLDSIRYWCRFSDSPITFNGQTINQELTVDSRLIVRHQQPGTEVVLGTTTTSPEPYGLYNRGLTLVEGNTTFFPGLAFRLKSRYLEHTLTRDSVLRDQNFEKAIRILRTVARTEMPKALFEQAGQHLANDLPTLDALLQQAAPFLNGWRRSVPQKLWDQPLFPTLHGPALSITGLRQAGALEGDLYIDMVANHVTESLWKVGVPVLRGVPGGGVAEAVAAVCGRLPVRASTTIAAPIVVQDAAQTATLNPLMPLLGSLLNDAHAGVRDIVLANFVYTGTTVADRPCLLQPDVDQPIRLHRTVAWWRRFTRCRLLLNTRHPLIHEALGRSRETPMLGAYVLAKAVMLQSRIPDGLEARWLARILASRPRLEASWFTRMTRRLTRRPKPA